MRQPSYARLLLLLVLSGALYGLMRHAQWTADARAAAGEARFRARAALYLESLYAQQGWHPHSTHGHWLATRGRRLVTDQGRRWHGIGADYEAGVPTPREASFVRVSAAPFFEDSPATEPARLLALTQLIERVSDQGGRYVLLGVAADSPWLWRAQMATLVAAFGDRPEVMFDVALAPSQQLAPESLMQEDQSESTVDALLLHAKARIEWIRQAERTAHAPKHVIAIDAASVASDTASHHGSELDYARCMERRLPIDNVVTIGRRPAYALRSANAWFVEPLRTRTPSVHPATL